MQAVNIRQLKKNPSQALRAAHEDQLVVVMNRDTPTALLVDLEKLGLPDVGAVREILAISLFKEAAVSAGAAARIAGKSLPEMLSLLSSMGIPLTPASRNEATGDMVTAREWLQRHS